MNCLPLYFENATELATHLDLCLIQLTASPFFTTLDADERRQVVTQHLALTAWAVAQFGH